jgi:sugar lactone lactonase YvrE
MKKFSSLALIAALAFSFSGVALPTALSQSATAPGEIFVANDISNTIDLATKGAVANVFYKGDGLNSPTGLAFDADGNLYVANTGTNTIERFTPSGAHSTFAGPHTGLVFPYGLAFDSTGNLYVSNQSDFGNTIVRFTPSGAHSVFADQKTGLANPEGIAFDAHDNLFVANEGFQDILRITPEGVSTVFAKTGKAGLEYPSGVAFDAAGNLYVVNDKDGGESDILRFTPAGDGSVFASKGLEAPEQLAFDSAGNLYVTNEQGFVQMFNSTGGGSNTFYQTGFDYPLGIAIRPAAKAPKPPAVSVKAKGDAMAVEGGAKGVFVLSRPASDDTAALPVHFKLQGTAQDGVNYAEIKSPVVIPAHATSANVTVTAIGAASKHGMHTVTLKLVAAGGYSVGSESKATVVIVGQP